MAKPSKELSEKQRELIEEANWLHASIIIEVQGNDQAHIRKSLENLVERLIKEKGIDVYSKEYDEIQELSEGLYSLNVEVKFLAKDFGRLVHVALVYSPSAFEIFNLKEIKVDVGEAQNILIDIANTVTSLAHAVFIQEGRIRKLQAELPPKKQEKK